MNGYAGRSLYSFGSKQGPTIKSCGGVLSGPKLTSFRVPLPTRVIFKAN